MTEQKNTCSALKNKTHSGAARGGRRWYEYLWIVSLAYLILGFFNILFAWLGLLCWANGWIWNVTWNGWASG